jgi:hypothetical protein
MGEMRRIRTFLRLPGAGGSTPKPNFAAGFCAKENLLWVQTFDTVEELRPGASTSVTQPNS